MKRNVLITIIVVAVILAALILYSVLSGKEKDLVLETEVQSGRFEIAVMVTGELQAIRETEIQAPTLLRSRSHRINNIKIQSLIPEGTVVDSGDWVATLDRTEADNQLKDILDMLEQEESEYTRVRLDTTLQLRQLRDELINLRFAMEEAEITLQQSKYEPPATIRQAEINLDKATRAYEQAMQNYDIKERQAKAEMREAEISLLRDQRRKEEMEEVIKNFDIMAPASGMVIYKREFDGTKRTVGTEINPWDLTVATLPDLSTMISRTYVNEIDISKIKSGQTVIIGVDAFPERKYSGEVVEVANIGEQLPNTDAKVFEVRIEINEYDTILRPSMTTSNRIITNVLDSVLFVPLEAVHTNDSLTYVYTMDGKKQIVVLGESNENSIVVEMGLHAGQRLYLSLPENPDDFNYTGMELVPEIKKRRSDEEKRIEEMNQMRQEQMLRRHDSSRNSFKRMEEMSPK
ncbi:MAG: efflux RND transporter periplasmic adaptor subunit [Bacteroidales bacterium]|nr:efflux RND transporter periplasmic adaptor subunit [Bacteroidales bacterium]MBN2699127.1 efflux RND transporter periplasmic adaptor subunit [Bacteroidales bacterium]